MNFPEKLPIERTEDYHTHYLGLYSGNRLFWGYETFFFPSRTVGREDWQNYRRDYVILHLFDRQGNHLETRSEFLGTAAESDAQASSEKLEQWVNDLGEVQYADIEVKLFQVYIDGVVFGLVPNTEDEDNPSIELAPSSTIAFFEPWDGSYYT
jgi:hypothetical protein